MAKSLRSKRRRKVRAEKRIVNAKKELVKLREVAARLHGKASEKGELLTKNSLESKFPDVEVNETPMLVDGADNENRSPGKRAKTSALTINNQWMNQRKIKAIKNKIKRHNQKKSRRGNSSGLSSRRTKKSFKT